jgi:hypothetical protein
MKNFFTQGTVQNIIERIIPLALTFDDNGELDLWLFHNAFFRCEGVTLNNFYGLADTISRTYTFGGTNYAPVMKDVDLKYIGEEPSNYPNYVIFITDGDNSDRTPATEVITAVSQHPIFWQFVGIGNSSFAFLNQLDNMQGRYIDNANFFSVNDIDRMSDDELYGKLFAEFPSWLSDAKVQNMLSNPYNMRAYANAPRKKGLFSNLFGIGG